MTESYSRDRPRVPQTDARPALRRVQLPGLGDRSDSDRPAIHAATTTARSSRLVAAALAFGRVASVLQSIERRARGHGAGAGRLRPRLRSAPRRARLRRHRPPLDARARPGRARLADGADDRPRRLDRGLLPRGRRPGGRRRGRRARRRSRRARWRSICARPTGASPRSPGAAFFFPRPSAGSGCKRLNLFLRWMVRKDALDLGVWSRVSPAKLVVPLDTHVIRVGRCLRLTAYTSPGWRMARDITASLRRLDPDDPVKYDFALCHIGMMNACGFSRPQGDAQCPLRGACRPRARRPRRSRRPSARR